MENTPITVRSTPQVFPAAEVKACLRRAIDRMAEDNAGMREPWEPDFDSMAIVDIVMVVEQVLPGLKIAPDKVVRKGGYSTADDAAQDVTQRLQRQWERHYS